MIKQGQKFNANDLRTSLDEVCNRDIKKFIAKPKKTNLGNGIGIIIGNIALYPADFTPYDYATICAREYCAVQSSARDLDYQIQKRGIKTTRRFSYKYNTGELDPNQIILDAHRLEWFNQISDYANLNVNNVFELAEYKDIIDDAFRLSYYYAQYLWAMNPNICYDIANALYAPYHSQWKQITGAILGIGYQFHPDDVYEFSVNHINPCNTQEQRNQSYKIQQKFKDDMMNKYDINTGCLVMAPQSRDKLQRVVTNTDTPYWIQALGKAFGFER